MGSNSKSKISTPKLMTVLVPNPGELNPGPINWKYPCGNCSGAFHICMSTAESAVHRWKLVLCLSILWCLTNSTTSTLPWIICNIAIMLEAGFCPWGKIRGVCTGRGTQIWTCMCCKHTVHFCTCSWFLHHRVIISAYSLASLAGSCRV